MKTKTTGLTAGEFLRGVERLNLLYPRLSPQAKSAIAEYVQEAYFYAQINSHADKILLEMLGIAILLLVWCY